MPIIRIEVTSEEYEMLKEVAQKARFTSVEGFVGYIVVNLGHIVEQSFANNKNPIDILEFIFYKCLNLALRKEGKE
jgi:hypothetical protein